jgi:hypothetical protein
VVERGLVQAVVLSGANGAGGARVACPLEGHLVAAAPVPAVALAPAAAERKTT